MRKDLGLALDEARANGATLPVAALVDQFYAEVRRWAADGRTPPPSSKGTNHEAFRLLLAALALPAPALADTLIDNVNGIQVDGERQARALQRH